MGQNGAVQRAVVALALVAALALAPRPADAIYYLTFKNSCKLPIAMAFRFVDPEKGWISMGWYNLKPGASVGPYPTRSPGFRVYAETTEGKIMLWAGNRTCNGCFFPANGISGAKVVPFTDVKQMSTENFLYPFSC